MPYSRKAKPSLGGFILLEILLLTALLGAAAAFCYVPSSAMLKSNCPLQLRIAAQRLAGDIRALQQKALFDYTIANRLVFLASGAGYYLDLHDSKANKYTYFRQIGCNGVYLSKKQSPVIRFSTTGAPIACAGEYLLLHSQVPDCKAKIKIQVASGRVDVEEI